MVVEVSQMSEELKSSDIFNAYYDFEMNHLDFPTELRKVLSITH